ncbi:MAG: hypothetical protein AAFP02_22020, partial [Bacteroidota bacterium]
MKKPFGSLLLSLILLPLGLVLLASAYPTNSSAEKATVYILRPAELFGDINPKFRRAVGYRPWPFPHLS